MKTAICAGLCASLVAAACSQQATRPDQPELAAAEQAPIAATEVDTRQPIGDAVTEPGLDEQVNGAIRDLALHIGVPEDEILVYSARSVAWGSAALGCPKAGMSYTQAIVPGMLVMLEAGGKIYRYHGREGRHLFHCPDDRAEAPAYGQGLDVM